MTLKLFQCVWSLVAGLATLSIDTTVSLRCSFAESGAQAAGYVFFLGGRMLLALDDPSHVLANFDPVALQGGRRIGMREWHSLGWVSK